MSVNGQLLTEARLAAGLRLEDVADKLECNKSAVSRWEREEYMPSDENILELAKLLGRNDFIVWPNGRQAK